MQECIRTLLFHIYVKPLVFHTWKVVGRVVGGCIQAHCAVPENVHQLHVQQPSMYEKPEDASAVLGS
jgi:hypothetical protein